MHSISAMFYNASRIMGLKFNKKGVSIKSRFFIKCIYIFYLLEIRDTKIEYAHNVSSPLFTAFIVMVLNAAYRKLNLYFLLYLSTDVNSFEHLFDLYLLQFRRIFLK